MRGLRRLVQEFKREFDLWRALAADPRTPRVGRWLLGAALVYALSPIDLIPDWIPVLGHLDDLVIVPLLVWLALRAVPRHLVEEHRQRQSDGPPP